MGRMLPLLVLGGLLTAPEPIVSQVSARAVAEGPALNVQQAMVAIKTAIDQAPPADLDPASASEYRAHTEWLRDVYARLESIKSPRDVATGQASGRQAVTPREPMRGQATGRSAVSGDAAATLEALRQAVEMESRRFQTLSNASKARHDVAMNAIRNMKA